MNTVFVKLISCRQFVLGVGEGALVPGRGGLFILDVWHVDGTAYPRPGISLIICLKGLICEKAAAA